MSDNQGSGRKTAQEIAPDRPAMVYWYDPGQLLRTGTQVALGTIFGRFADTRLVEALSACPDTDDVSPEKTLAPTEGEEAADLWLDYVADVGDGWNSTYAVAHWLARSKLGFDEPKRVLPRGEVFVFGGDLAYPVASRESYARRLLAPYETALPRDTDAPVADLYALPGNHDWYDNLVAFRRRFLAGRRFAHWQTKQRLSYFAVRLRHGWWLLGADFQLGADIDTPQVEFFRSVAARMNEDDRIILCIAEPQWTISRLYRDEDERFNENNLRFLDEDLLQGRVKLYLAGDHHHYRRHSSKSGRHLITCGGGGAFLHPTHGSDVSKVRLGDAPAQGMPAQKTLERTDDSETFELEVSYPTSAITRRLAWRNLLIGFLNPTLGLTWAWLYWTTAWLLRPTQANDAGTATDAESSAAAFLSAVGVHLLSSPVSLVWCLALLAAFILFTDTHSKSHRVVGGLLHASAHIALALSLLGASLHIGQRLLAGSTEELGVLALASAILLLGAYVVGPFIEGIYLLISLNLFGRHANEAFSSLRLEDYKCFLRMKIDISGALHLYAIGLDRVPRQWKRNPAGPPLLIAETDDERCEPKIIDEVIIEGR